MKLRTLTDIGAKRVDNQDNYWSAILDVDSKEIGVLCLCDGMGGLKDGALASKIVVEAVREYFTHSVDFKGLEDVLKEANILVNSKKTDEDGCLGTTCTVLKCYEGIYEILHIGDSRCYHKKGNEVIQLTEDHTVIEKYRKMGKELPDNLVKKYRNTLTRCMGVKEDLVLDYYSGFYSSGDLFLVCSDGFWHSLNEESFLNGALEDLSSMVSNCISNGETDNITVGILEV